MAELSVIEIIKNSLIGMSHSKVLILFILEAAILLISLIFSKFINKKLVKSVSIISSLILVGFYLSNYINTVTTFLNNVSTKLIEFIYFPTTLEFMIVMIVSFVIMFITLIGKSNKFIKVVNSILPISISFIFLSIIEYINVNKIEFNEFSTFTDVNLMSLYELGMGIFISWLIALVIYKVDKLVLNRIKTKEIVLPKLKVEDDIELPKLKESRV